jgi:anthranilate/para-aminobenzoate synthase component I
MITPSKRDFLELVKNGKPPAIYEEIPYLPPQSIYEPLASPNSFLLESIKGPMKIARYSFIGFDPYLVFKVKNGIIEIETPDEIGRNCKVGKHDKSNPPIPPLEKGGEGGFERLISEQQSKNLSKPLNVLKELVTSYRQMPFDHLPPFQGGAVGILSYDFVQYLERLPSFAVDDLTLPDAHFLMVDRLVAFDHQEKKCWIIVCPGAKDNAKDNIDWSEKYDDAENEIEKILKKVKSYKLKVKNKDKNSSLLTRYSNPPAPPFNAPSTSYDLSKGARLPSVGQGYRGVKGGQGEITKIEINYEMKKDEYMDMVKRAKEYIAAGDIFQANLSQRVSAHIGDVSRWSIYRTLSSINPAPFAAFMDFGDYQIISSSPERLLKVRNGIIETRPIAGTRPRGRDWKEDEFMRAELLLNEKERAEHIMLVDLERNDLGRVSDYGTVKVDELMITEDCSHVIHIVSNVRGSLANEKDCFDAIKAAFPGGTITGVPKIRCMEIIEELEPVKRGHYTGSMGYISFSGSMDLNIVIRTFVIKGERAYVQAGAGIVADSDPEREYYETLKKAEALIRTLERIK